MDVRYIIPGLSFWVATSFISVAAQEFRGEANATLERVIDGDTVKMRVAVWIDQEIIISVRIAGIDAPELFRPKCQAEKALAREAKTFVEDAMTGGRAILTDIEPDKYSGRVVAEITADGINVGAALVAAGLAVDGPRGNWCATS